MAGSLTAESKRSLSVALEVPEPFPDLLRVQAHLAQRAAGAAVRVLERGEQDVVDADITVAALDRLAQGELEDRARVVGDAAPRRHRRGGRRALDERRLGAAARVGER